MPKTTQQANFWKKNTLTTGLGPFCVAMRKNEGEKGQSVTVPFKIIIRHWNIVQYLISYDKHFPKFKIWPILVHPGCNLAVKSVANSLSSQKYSSKGEIVHK